MRRLFAEFKESNAASYMPAPTLHDYNIAHTQDSATMYQLNENKDDISFGLNFEIKRKPGNKFS